MFTFGMTRPSLPPSVPICKDKHDHVNNNHCLSTVFHPLSLSLRITCSPSRMRKERNTKLDRKWMLWGVAAVCLTEHGLVPVLVFVYSLVFS